MPDNSKPCLPQYHLGFLRGYFHGKDLPPDVMASIEALHAAAVRGIAAAESLVDTISNLKPPPTPPEVREERRVGAHRITAMALGISQEELAEEMRKDFTKLNAGPQKRAAVPETINHTADEQPVARVKSLTAEVEKARADDAPPPKGQCRRTETVVESRRRHAH